MRTNSLLTFSKLTLPAFRRRPFLLSFLLFFILTFFPSFISSAQTFGGGNGSQANPYQIKTAAHLKELSALVQGDATSGYTATNGKYFKLMNDINMAGITDFTPIGGWSDGSTNSNARRFDGNFDGGGYKISNLTINQSTKDRVALFGYTHSNATISNLGVDGAFTGKDYVGGLVGDNNAKVTNCYSTATIVANSNSGGLIGSNWKTTVTDCYATGSVTATNSHTGGLVGYNQNNSTVSNSYATGVVTGTFEVGGLVGYNYNNSTVSNSYATGTVTGSNNSIGGLVGRNENTSTVTNSYATGAVTGNGTASNSGVGGLVGQNFTGCTVSNSYAAPASIGGASPNKGVLIGLWNGGTLTNCYYLSSVSGITKGLGSGTATGHTAKTAAELKAVAMVAALNNGGTTWKADFTPAINSGYPILAWQEGWEGKGTAEDPYQIYTTADLQRLSLLVMTETSAGSVTGGKHFKLMNDLDFSGVTDFIPIGGWSDNTTNIDTKSFAGTFDGGGFVIKNLSIDKSDKNYVGLFGINAGTVKNLGVVGGKMSGNNQVGGVVGYNILGTVENCYNTGTVSGSGTYVGGVVGTNSGTVQNCYNTGSVTGSNNVGGVVGYNDGTVANCYNSGTVNGSRFVGGVVGWNYDGTVENCYNSGNVTGSGNVGGVVGWNTGSSAKVQNCYNTATVSGTGNYVGGVVGENNRTVANCYYLKEGAVNAGLNGIGMGSGWAEPKTAAELKEIAMVTALNSLGSAWKADFTPAINSGYPILTWQEGWEGKGTAEDPYQIKTIEDMQRLSVLVMTETSAGSVTGGKHFKLVNDLDFSGVTDYIPIGGWSNNTTNSNAKRFAGTFDGGGFVVKNLTVDKSDKDYVGLFGYNAGTVKNLGVVGGKMSGNGYVGGVVGWNNGGTVENCYNTGTVSGTGNCVGGVVGYNDGTVANCYNSGSVNGSGHVGGVVGANDGLSAKVENCYNSGPVSSGTGDGVGGVVGANNGGTVQNCYNSGSVNGSGHVGGVVGANDGPSAKVQNCYNTGTVSGTGNYVGGVVGHNTHIVQNCYNSGTVNGSRFVGGVVGWNYDGTVENCYNTGTVSGTGNYVGGVVGYNNIGIVANCYNTGNVSGSDNQVGGVVGYNSSYGIVRNCYYLKEGTVNAGLNGIGTGSGSAVAKTAAELKAAAMVTALNNGGTAWKADFTLHHNQGYPILDWQVQTLFTLTFNAAGGSLTSAVTVTYNQPVGTLPTPVRTGYTFGGWTIDNTTITAATVWTYPENKTAVARWTANTYTLSFDAAGGSSTSAVTVTYNQAVGTLPAPVRAGYTFGGWKIDNTAITAATVWTYPDSKTAVARWTADNLYLKTLFGESLLGVVTRTPAVPITDYQYRWTKNNSPLPDTKQYIRLSGSGHYSVEVTTTAGEVIRLDTTYTAKAKPLVYPNPATTVLNIDLTATDISATDISATLNVQSIEIFDIMGKRVLQLPAAEVIDVSTLPPGIYTVKAGNYITKIIKQ